MNPKNHGSARRKRALNLRFYGKVLNDLNDPVQFRFGLQSKKFWLYYARWSFESVDFRDRFGR